MTRKLLEQFTAKTGFFSNQAKIGEARVPDSLIDGSYNVWVEGPGRVRSWTGISSQTASGGGSLPGGKTAMLVGDKVGTLDSGTIASFTGGSTFYIGSGPVFVNGVSITPNADSSLRVLASGQTMAVIAGLAKPSTAPVLTPIDGKTTIPPGVQGAGTIPPLQVGRCNGSLSIKVSPIKNLTSTHAEGNASDQSNTITASNCKIRLFFPPTVPNQTGWRIYATIFGNGSVGPWRLVEAYADINNTMIISLDFDYVDGELDADRTAPIDNDQALPGTHVFTFNSRVVVAGVLGPGGAAGGGGLLPSKVGNPEAFSPDTIFRLNPFEPILCIKGRAADGVMFVGCRNSLHQIIEGGAFSPIFSRAIWSDTGIANKNAMVEVHGVVYCMTGNRSLARTRGNSTEPDYEFALPVENLIETFNPLTTVLGFSPENNAVVFFDGKVGIAYKLSTQQWSAPFYLPLEGSVESAVTYKSNLYISIANVMYIFSPLGLQANTGMGLDYAVLYAWKTGGEDVIDYPKTIYNVRAFTESAMPITAMEGLTAGFIQPTVMASFVPMNTSGQWTSTGAYYYAVAALDAAGNITTIDVSKEVSITVTSTMQVVNLTWNGVPGAVLYRLYRGTATGFYDTFFETSANSYNDDGLVGASGITPNAATIAQMPGTMGDITTEILGNFDEDNVLKAITTTGNGKVKASLHLKCNVKMDKDKNPLYAYTIRHKGMGANQIIHAAIVRGNIHAIRK